MIAVIQYNAGNTRSVANALERLGYRYCITDNAADIIRAEKVILPGVGEARSAMQYLQKKGLDKIIPMLSQPVLGICLGLQLLCRHSEEGDTEGMGIFDTTVKKFPPVMNVPHMGWNNMTELQGNLFKGIPPTADVYYVHSYYADLCMHTTAVCDYILPFSASLQHNNFYATQFHPEKSAAAGAHIIKNFLAL